MAVPATVLVVDDEENINYLVASALPLAGLRTVRVSTGSAAFEFAEAYSPDAIVLDVMLPDLDGFEVLRRLGEGGTLVPVVFLTARTGTADRVRGLTAGVDYNIVKPFAPEELVARVQPTSRRTGATTQRSRLQVHDLALDTEAHRVRTGAPEARLTATEPKLIHTVRGIGYPVREP